MNMHPQGGVASRDHRPNAGIDVAKQHLDACWADVELRVANDASGHDELTAKLKAADVDLVMVEATAASATELLTNRGSRAAASVAYCSEVPVWAVAGRGRCLPDAAFASLVTRVSAVRVPWDAEVDVVPLGLATYLATERGVLPIDQATLAPECPLAHELLR